MLASTLALFSDPIWGPMLISGLTLVAHTYFPVFAAVLSKLPGAPSGTPAATPTASPAATPAATPPATPAMPVTPAHPASTAHPVLSALETALPQILLAAQKVLLASTQSATQPAMPSGGTVMVPLGPATPPANVTAPNVATAH